MPTRADGRSPMTWQKVAIDWRKKAVDWLAESLLPQNRLLHRCQKLRQAGAYSDALRCADRLLQRRKSAGESNQATVFLLKGQILCEAGRTVDAIEPLRSAFRFGIHDTESLQILARHCLAL